MTNHTNELKKSATQEKQPESKADQDAAAPKAKGNAWRVERVLKVGKPMVQGEDVKALQAILEKKGYYCGKDTGTGVYGKDTAHAVRMFQAENRLIIDGRAGKHTVKKLGGTWAAK